VSSARLKPYPGSAPALIVVNVTFAGI
jgi:hypothetical protein